MLNKEIFVSSAYLATKQKNIEKYLLTGKITREDFSNGFLFYLIELPANLKATKAPKKIVGLLKTIQFSQNDIEKSFENALKNLNNSLNDIAKHGDNDWVGSLNSIIGFIKDDQLGITQSGTILGYIFRKGKVSAITENFKQAEPHPLKTYIDFTLGKISPEDKLVFANTEFFNHLSLNRVREIVCNAEANQAAFQLCSHLKKFHLFDANAVILNAINDNKTADNLPDTYYIDEPEETFIDKTIKLLRKSYRRIIQPYAVKLAAFSQKQTEEMVAKTKETWHRDLKPGMTKMLEKTSQTKDTVVSSIKNAETKTRKINNLKTNHYQKQEKNDRKINLSSFYAMLHPALAKLKVLTLPKNRKYLYAGLVILFLIFSFFKLSANNSSKSGEKKEQEFVLSYDQAEEKFNKIKEDVALGRAGDHVAELEETLSLSKKAELSKSKSTEAKALSKEIQTNLDTLSNASRIYSTSPSDPFNGKINKIVLVGQDIYGVDTDGKIYSFNTNDKEVRLVGSIGKDNADLADLSYSENEKRIFLQTKNGKIIDFDPTTKTSGEIKAADPGWEQGISIASYVTNIYILDSAKNIIWKHTKKETGYSKGSTYSNSQKADLTNSVDLAVDGNLYILKSTGIVLKLSQGTADSFSLKDIKGSNKTLSSPTKIIADGDSNFIYILDKAANRIVRFNKSGDFINQYYMDGSNIDDFLVNSKIQKMWISSAGKMFEVKL